MPMRKKTERRRTNRGTAAITYWIWAERSGELSPFVGFSRTAKEQTGILEASPNYFLGPLVY
jgi:hypothetical protein